MRSWFKYDSEGSWKYSRNEIYESEVALTIPDRVFMVEFCANGGALVAWLPANACTLDMSLRITLSRMAATLSTT